MEAAKAINSGCVLHDYGVIVSVHTADDGKTTETFKHIKSKYDNYKEHVSKTIDRYYRINPNTHLEKTESNLTGFYEPLGYYLWGPFDLCVLSCVDSFSLAPQLHVPQSDSVQLSLNVVPKLGSLVSGNDWFISPAKVFGVHADSLEEKNFIKEYLPLFAYCRLKINPLLTITSGTSFFKKALRSMSSKVSPQGSEEAKNRIRCCALEPLGWNELSLLIFGADYTEMVSQIVKIRETRLEEVIEDEEELFQLANDPAIRKTLGDSSDSSRMKFLSKISPYSATWTVLGIDIELFESLHKSLDRMTDLETKAAKANELAKYLKDKHITGEVIADVSIAARPGKLTNLERVLDRISSPQWPGSPLENKLKTLHTFSSNPDQQDVLWHIGEDNNYSPPSLPTEQFIVEFIRVSSEILDNNNVRRHTTGLTIPLDRQSIVDAPQNESTQEEKPLQWMFNRFQFAGKYGGDNGAEKPSPHDAARLLELPRYLRSEIESAIAVYDSVISNEVLFDSVIDLGIPLFRLMNNLIASNKSFPKAGMPVYKWNAFVRQVDNNVGCLRRALANRLNASFPFKEVSDYTLEFKGGIQHLLTSLDAVIAAGLFASARNFLDWDPIFNLPGFTIVDEARNGRIDMLPIGGAVHKNMSETMQPETYPVEIHESYHYVHTRLPELANLRKLFKIYADKVLNLWNIIAPEFPEPKEWLDSLLEDIAADQTCRDTCFSQDPEGNALYRKWFGLHYLNKAYHASFVQEEASFRYALIVRYLLSSCSCPEQSDLKNHNTLREYYRQEIHECAEWIPKDALLRQLDIGHQECWYKIWLLFYVLDNSDEATFTKDEKNKIRACCNELNKKFRILGDEIDRGSLPRPLKLLFTLRQARLHQLRQDTQYLNCPLEFKSGNVASFNRNAARANQDNQILYTRYVLETYLKHLFDTIPHLERIGRVPETGEYNFSPGDPTIVIDPVGGCYPIGSSIRRKHFMATCACIFSLWDLGLYVRYERLSWLLNHM